MEDYTQFSLNKKLLGNRGNLLYLVCWLFFHAVAKGFDLFKCNRKKKKLKVVKYAIVGRNIFVVYQEFSL